MKDPCPWTPEEDQILRNAVALRGWLVPVNNPHNVLTALQTQKKKTTSTGSKLRLFSKVEVIKTAESAGRIPLLLQFEKVPGPKKKTCS